MHRLKRCEYNDEAEDNSPYSLTDKNCQASSKKKIRQMIFLSNRNNEDRFQVHPILIIFKYIYLGVTQAGSTPPDQSGPRSIGIKGGARGVMVIVVGNGHGDTSSNPVRN